MAFHSPISKARGLGTAKEGSHHWLAQRMTALALIPLCIWFVAFVMQLAGTGLDGAKAVALIAKPCNALLSILFIIAAFYHGALGLQAVLEDYMPGKLRKIIAVMLVKLTCFATASAGIFAVLSIYFKG